MSGSRRRSCGLRRLRVHARVQLRDDVAAGRDDLLDELRRHHDAVVRDRRPRPSPSAAASRAAAPGRTRAGPGRPACPGPSGRRACASSGRRARTPSARRTASRAAASSRSRTSSPARGSRFAPSFLPMLQKTALIECSKAVDEVDVAERLGPVWSGSAFVDLLAVLGAVAGVVERRVGRVDAAIERRRRGDDLERRARRVEALRGAVQERRRLGVHGALRRLDLRVAVRLLDQVRVEASATRPSRRPRRSSG